ncbi:MAG: hypothetical protein RR645_05860, partial [Clostridium sp.]
LDYNILYSLGILYKESDSSVFLPTYGGVLLFCDYPQKFLPHCIIRIHNHNNTLSSPIIICDGNILDMLNYAANIINICKPPSIPIEVIEDLLGNSVVHRDYFFINTPIEVYIKEDSIEIINPGFKKHRDNTETYIRRNMWLYLKLLSLDSTKRFYNKSIKAKSYSNNEITIRYYNIKVKNLFKVVVKYK